MTVREYDGASIDPARLLRTTLSQFYQGSGWNAASGWSQGWNICTPATVANGPQTDVVESDACYVNMLKSELWKGRPKTVSVFNGNGTLVKTTDYTYDYTGLLLAFSTSDPSYKRSGLWRAFTPTLIVREALNGKPDLSNSRTPCNPSHRLEYNQWLTIAQPADGLWYANNWCGACTDYALALHCNR